jgi:hypothetical protein
VTQHQELLVNHRSEHIDRVYRSAFVLPVRDLSRHFWSHVSPEFRELRYQPLNVLCQKVQEGRFGRGGTPKPCGPVHKGTMLGPFDWYTVIAIGIIAALVLVALIVSWLISRRGPPDK